MPQFGIKLPYKEYDFIDLVPLKDAVDLFPNIQTNMHSNNFYMIECIRNGKGIHFTENQEKKAPSNSMFFTSPRHIHRYEAEEISNSIAIILEQLQISVAI